MEYVTKAGVHRFTDLAERGLQAAGSLGDSAQEEKRQALMELFKHTPGSPDFPRQMVSLMAPGMKQRLESLVGKAHRQRHGHRDNLRSDDLAGLPSEPVGLPVTAKHGRRSRTRQIVARQAGLGGLDRAGQE